MREDSVCAHERRKLRIHELSDRVRCRTINHCHWKLLRMRRGEIQLFGRLYQLRGLRCRYVWTYHRVVSMLRMSSGNLQLRPWSIDLHTLPCGEGQNDSWRYHVHRLRTRHVQ